MIAIAGDNSTVLTEGEVDAHLGDHVAERIRIENEIKELKAELKDLEKDFAKEGGNKKLASLLVKALEDGDGMLKKHSLNEQALQRAGRLHGKPSDLLDRVSQEQLIFARGRMAGLCSAMRVSGEDAGSSRDKIWIEGYEAGKRCLEENLPSARDKIARRLGDEPPPEDVAFMGADE